MTVELVPRETTLAWLSHLRSQGHAAFAFKSASAFLPASSEPAGKGKEKDIAFSSGKGKDKGKIDAFNVRHKVAERSDEEVRGALLVFYSSSSALNSPS